MSECEIQFVLSSAKGPSPKFHRLLRGFECCVSLQDGMHVALCALAIACEGVREPSEQQIAQWVAVVVAFSNLPRFSKYGPGLENVLGHCCREAFCHLLRGVRANLLLEASLLQAIMLIPAYCWRRCRLKQYGDIMHFDDCKFHKLNEGGPRNPSEDSSLQVWTTASFGGTVPFPPGPCTQAWQVGQRTRTASVQMRLCVLPQVFVSGASFSHWLVDLCFLSCLV